MLEYAINSMWDDEARGWAAASEDVPGLVMEDDSLEALTERVKLAVPELIELNNNRPA